MKRNLLLGLLTVMFMMLIGCGKAPTPTQSGQVQNQKTIEPTNIGKEISLDNAAMKKMNVFFNNFAEAAVPTFEKDKLSNEELIKFGIKHNFINNGKLIEKCSVEGYDRKIAAKYVEQSVNKYFGKGIVNTTCKAYQMDENTANFQYKDGYYLIPQNRGYQIDPALFGGGESIEFSQVSKILDNGDNYFTAYLNVYKTFDDYGIAGEEFYESPQTWNSKYANDKDRIPTLEKKLKATIKKESDGRYILIDYLEDK